MRQVWSTDLLISTLLCEFYTQPDTFLARKSTDCRRCEPKIYRIDVDGDQNGIWDPPAGAGGGGGGGDGGDGGGDDGGLPPTAFDAAYNGFSVGQGWVGAVVLQMRYLEVRRREPD